jgi:hypothetical protein
VEIITMIGGATMKKRWYLMLICIAMGILVLINPTSALVTNINEDIAEFKPELSKEYQGTKIVVKKVTFSKGRTEINLEVVKPIESLDKETMEFNVWNDFGVMLPTVLISESGKYKNKEFVLEYTLVLEPFPKPNSLLIKPAIREHVIGENSSSNSNLTVTNGTSFPEHMKNTLPLENKYPIILNQGKMGEVLITDVDYKSDKTLVYLTAIGKSPYLQASNIWLEDESGRSYFAKYKPILQSYKENNYVYEFLPINSKEKLNITTIKIEPLNYIENLEFKITLN